MNRVVGKLSTQDEMKELDLIGEDYLWKLVLGVEDSKVFQEIVDFLVKLYQKVSWILQLLLFFFEMVILKTIYSYPKTFLGTRTKLEKSTFALA
jgi:hypothetical protein